MFRAPRPEIMLIGSAAAAALATMADRASGHGALKSRNQIGPGRRTLYTLHKQAYGKPQAQSLALYDHGGVMTRQRRRAAERARTRIHPKSLRKKLDVRRERAKL